MLVCKSNKPWLILINAFSKSVFDTAGVFESFEQLAEN